MKSVKNGEKKNVLLSAKFSINNSSNKEKEFSKERSWKNKKKYLKNMKTVKNL
jgi:hypothetical protein